MYGMTTLDPSVNFPLDELGFILVLLSLGVWLVERTVCRLSHMTLQS